eukprot:TRINITY_DN6049_c1_g1_i1.p1 TRINITY_DN6049_c1_g1~~TRINITY_DN6049_c1_g1_i1.p1  ORF type:complete len:346 (+),score=149.23 TRINITY_DN6049_c1_g1_i1:53-1039(+)
MVHFAPIRIPIERRLQTATVLLFFLTPIICLIAIIIAPLFWPFALFYLCYMLFDKAPFKGGRPLAIIRRFPLFKLFCAFFPAKLIVSKTEAFDSKKKYVFGIHPHGIIGLSVWTSFLCDIQEPKKKLNNIDYRVLTLQPNFYFPLWREIVLGCGLIDSSRNSAEYCLKTGKSVMIVVGGAAEALNARPGTVELTLKKRKGFISLAMQNEAQLVPVFAFGENELYDQVPNPPGSFVRKIQDKIKKTFGFTVPLIKGRGIFLYDFGLLPRRVKLVTVVGQPIPTPFIPKPTEKQVELMHVTYIKALENLYHEFAQLYNPNGIPYEFKIIE